MVCSLRLKTGEILKRPSIALCCILKNEVDNLPQLLASVKGCFDEIHLTDTGSTDGSIELIETYAKDNPAETPVFLHHFKWIDDFAAARNASFAPAQTDYVMWMDLDDVLGSPEKFIAWRDSVMCIASFWLATYHYSSNPQGKPLCSFARERVVKRDLNLQWKYFVHEGITPIPCKKPVTTQYATTWSVIHKRTEQDVQKDRSRNLMLFEKRRDSLDARMRYYYGKELFENQKPLEAFQELISAIALPDLELHDRIMGIQYAALSAMQLNQFERAIQLSQQGLQISPLRAEFFVVVADCYVKLGKMLEAMPFYTAATACPYTGQAMQQGALYVHEESYKHYPLNMLAKVNAQFGNMDKAEKLAKTALEHGSNFETEGILRELSAIKEKAGLTILAPKADADEIVISCHPTGFYEWDEGIYRSRGIGGSETAVVEMSRHLHELTGRKVLVFNNRDTARELDGVNYLPAKDLPLYFGNKKPFRHIAWRHNVKFTDSPTYLWCHDLACQLIEQTQNYEKVLALSPFHKGFISNMYGVPLEKIAVTANGIDPNRFIGTPKNKDLNKVVYSSSPDRGLDKAIEVMDIVVSQVPDAQLHVYYGFDNMRLNGMSAEADRLDALVKSRPYVKFHGNLPQSELTKELASASVWLYPTNFLETYCITAIEMLCSKVWPVVRHWGALPDTLAKSGQGTIIDGENTRDYANATVSALRGRRCDSVEVDPNDYAWRNVAKSWIELLSL